MKLVDIVLTPPTLWKSNVLTDKKTGPIVIGVGTPSTEDSGISTLGAALSLAGTAAGVYHGYKRTNSVGWTLGWGLFGGSFPVIAIPWMLAQGFAQRSGK